MINIGEQIQNNAVGEDYRPLPNIDANYGPYVSASAPLASASTGSNRNPTGWTTSVPVTTASNPYLWFIQANIAYANNSDRVGTVDGTWTTPHLFTGINGQPGANGADGAPGQPGAKGQVIYPAGIYDSDIVYQTTDKQAPYVYDTKDKNYYILNRIGSWYGESEGVAYPSEDTTGSWVRLEAFEAIYAKVGIIANGLIGSAVFNGNFMFSQQGVDSSGNTSTNYELFNPNSPMEGAFVPNLCIDFTTGKVYAAGGAVVFADGEAQFGKIITGVTNPFTAKECAIKSTYTIGQDVSNTLVVSSVTTTIDMEDIKIVCERKGGDSGDGFSYASKITLTGYPSTGDNSRIILQTGGPLLNTAANIIVENRTDQTYVTIGNAEISFANGRYETDNSNSKVTLNATTLSKLLALVR